MKLTSIFLGAVLSQGVAAQLRVNKPGLRQDVDETVEVIIGLDMDDDENQPFAAMSEKFHQLGASVNLEKSYSGMKAGLAKVPRSTIESLKANPQVRYVEENLPYFHQQSETIPPGISQGLGAGLTPTNVPLGQGVGTVCSDPTALKIAVLDSGIDLTHFDFLYCGLNPETGANDPTRPTHCMGQSFVSGKQWYNSKINTHGTHVAGTVAASGLNDAGVAGMMGDEKFCLMIGRIFPDSGGASLQSVVDAIEWAADNGADVINMSFGTSADLQSMQDAITYALNKDIVLVASAGNGANDNPPVLVNYPAKYGGVMAVAAVDINGNIADFSSYYPGVGIAAVGVNVFSTLPLTEQALPNKGVRMSVNWQGGSTEALHFRYSNYVSGGGVTGPLVGCGQGNVCLGNGGHICLIWSPSIGTSDYDLVRKCELSNGVGAILFEPDPNYNPVGLTMGFSGNSPRFTSIPAVYVTGSDGGWLLNNWKLKEVTINGELLDGWGGMSGTSMSSPTVAGAAGLLKRRCPSCNRSNTFNCLYTSATDAGTPGYDPYYGHGILNTKAALDCMTALSCCANTPPVDEAIPNVCLVECDEEEKFCDFDGEKMCAEEFASCQLLCDTAVSQGKIGAAFVGECKNDWCVDEQSKCVAEEYAACDTEKTKCQLECQGV